MMYKQKNCLIFHYRKKSDIYLDLLPGFYLLHSPYFSAINYHNMAPVQSTLHPTRPHPFNHGEGSSSDLVVQPFNLETRLPSV